MRTKTLNETGRWLRRLHGKSPGHLAVTAFARGKVAKTLWFTADELADAAKTARDTAKSGDVYVSVATHGQPAQHGRGTGASVISLPGFAADIDIGTEGHKPAKDGLPNPATEDEAMSILDGLPEPSMIAHTGGGLQVWWLFDEPWQSPDPREAQAWQDMLVRRGRKLGFHVDSVGDLARILRVPGTQNRKLPENVRPVVARVLDGPTYPVAELTALTYVPTPSDSSWRDILTPHFVEVGKRESDGATFWRAAGSSNSHSAVTDPYGVPVMVNWSETSGLPTGPGQHLTKTKVAALLSGDQDTTHQDAVSQEAEKLRIRAEAKEVFAREQIEQRPLAVGLPLEELTSMDQKDSYRIENMLPSSGRVMLAAEKKTGKTTMVINLVRCLVTGEPFLGEKATEKVTGKVAVADFEMPISKLADWYRRANLRTGNVYIWVLRGKAGSFNVLDVERRAEIAAQLRQQDAQVLIIDPLRPVTAALGLDENSNSDMGRFLDAIDALINEAGLTEVIVIHHTGHEGHHPRGAKTLEDWPDAIWYYTRTAGDDFRAPRYLRAEGRDVELPKTKIRYDEFDLRLRLCDETRNEHEMDVDARILDHLRSVMTSNYRAIHDTVGGRRETVTARLDWLTDEGLIARQDGPRGAHIYTLSDGTTTPFEPNLLDLAGEQS